MPDSILNSYPELLRAYVGNQDESLLAEAAELGRELVLANLHAEDVAEYHERALRDLAAEQPDIAPDTIISSSALLMELLMAYGLAFREQVADLKKKGEALTERDEHIRSIPTTCQGSSFERC